MRAVIDTNVLLVANEQHADVSTECVSEAHLYDLTRDEFRYIAAAMG